MAQETQSLTPRPLVRRGPERAAACTKNARDMDREFCIAYPAADQELDLGARLKL